MGPHGRSGLDRLLLGSVTEKVLRKANCPVLTVPPQHPDAVPASPVLFKQILCPVDFSDCSMEALRYATSLAQEADAHLAVLHVLSFELDTAPDVDNAILTDDGMTVGDYRRQREEEAWRRLKEAVPGTVAEYCSVETLVASGKPSREILRVAAERMFFGSTTNHAVRHAQCPVLTPRRH